MLFRASVHLQSVYFSKCVYKPAKLKVSFASILGEMYPVRLCPHILPGASWHDRSRFLAGPMMEVADKNNPKLKAYMSDIKAARGEKELAESAYHPKINFEVGPSYSDRSGPGSQWTSGVDAGLVMRWNLFNSGADKAGTEAAESRTRMATETLYNFHDELALEIENTWTRYLAAKEQKKYYEEAIGYNTATRDAYLEQFKLGERSLLDVLDAESELFNSSTQYTTANGNVVVGAYRLYALTGMLLPELGIKEDPLYESPRNQQEKR